MCVHTLFLLRLFTVETVRIQEKVRRSGTEHDDWISIQTIL